MREKETKELSHRKPSKAGRLDRWAQGTPHLSCLREFLRHVRAAGVRSLPLIRKDYAEDVC